MILLDGQICDSPLLLDRGLAYGDGLFETIALRDGQLLCWSAHMARLQRGCAVLGIVVPDLAQLLQEARHLAGERAQGVVKILLTRGSGGRGYRPSAQPQTRRIVSLHEWPAELDTDTTVPVATWVCQQRLGHQPQLAGIKHLNRLEQVLASAEWPSADYFEGLMLDFNGHVIEGIRSNLFVRKGADLLTPDLGHAGIAGVVREAVMAFAPAHGLGVRLASLDVEQLGTADEVFLCNSVMGLRVVGRIEHDGQSMQIANNGTALELAAALREADVIP